MLDVLYLGFAIIGIVIVIVVSAVAWTLFSMPKDKANEADPNESAGRQLRS